MKARHGWMALRIAIFGLAALVFNFPLLATIVTSLKSEAEINENPNRAVTARHLD